MPSAVYRSSVCFNPRTHMGCDGLTPASRYWRITFQSTHPHGVRHVESIVRRRWSGFQSTHPHGVRLHRRWHLDQDLRVSIHAPTWGATSLTRTQLNKVQKFQSTHPHGVRPNTTANYSWSCCFNPRTHMGCDGCWLIIAFCGHRRFNPRTHMGCDFRLCSRYTVLRLFQSTHPHGVRLKMVLKKWIHICFNPRTHMGCDS